MSIPRLCLCGLLLVTLAGRGPAQPPGPVTFADVLRMVKEEFKEDKIVRLVRQSPTAFVLSPAQVAELKAAGATQALIDALAKPGPAMPTGSDVGAVVIVLDCSGSMAEPVPGGGTKWAAAQQAARDLIAAVVPGRDVALIVYGTDAGRQCDSVDVLRPMGPAAADTAADLQGRVDRLRPAGYTPIARSLEAAGQQLARTTRLAKVVLITDGMDTCHGEPAKVAAGLKAAHKHLQSVEVIGLGLKPQETASVGDIAKAGGGKFYDARSAKGLAESVKQVQAAVKAEPEPADGLTAEERKEFALMHVLVQRCYGSVRPAGSCSLHTEVLVNGKSAGVFASEAAVPVGKLLRKGENALQFRTFSPGKSDSGDPVYLWFQFGPAHRRGEQVAMDRVLWTYYNVCGWTFQEGTRTWVHKADPDAKDATVTAKVYFTGLRCEKVARNDYVLSGDVKFVNRDMLCPLTATAFVNDVPVNSVFGSDRAVSLTPWLRPGNNTVRVVVRGLDNHLGPDNPLNLVIGQAKFDAGSGGFKVIPSFTQAAEEEIRRNDDGKWVSTKDPKADRVTYTHELTVNDPKPQK